MSEQLKGKKVAILATNGFEEIELTNPREELHRAGAETHLISPEKTTIKSWDQDNWGIDFDVDRYCQSRRQSTTGYWPQS